MTTEALTAGTVGAAADPRTQPMQPFSRRGAPAQLFGTLPPGLVAGPEGAFPSTETSGPVDVLDWLLPN
ncbi:MAG: hypothetical protein AB7S26_33255 [Sandaracinaceae bacterium]